MTLPKKTISIMIVFCVIISCEVAVAEQPRYQHVFSIQSPELGVDSLFGYSIACDETNIIVGELWSEVDENRHAGRAHIFDTDGTLSKSIQAPTPGNEARFGNSLDYNGEILVIGEVLAGVGEIDYSAGEVHVFDNEWNLQTTLTSSEPVYGGRFGRAVAICGDKIILSESGANYDGFSHAGLVYIYDFDGNRLATLQSPEPFEGGGSGGNFGFSLAAHGDCIVVSEVHTTVEGKIGAGRAFIFDMSGELQASLESPEPQMEGEFGRVVAVIDELVIIGEYGAEVEGHSKAGKVHVYDLEGNLLFSIQSPQPDYMAFFGRDLAASEELIIVGERGANGEGIDEGRVHLYDLSGNWIESLQAPEPTTNAEFGSFVAVSGDTIAVGERSAVLGEYNAGMVHMYRLGSTEPQGNRGNIVLLVAVLGVGLMIAFFFMYQRRAA